MQMDSVEFFPRADQESQLFLDEILESLRDLFPDDTLTTSPNTSIFSQAEQPEIPGTVDPSELVLEAPPESLLLQQEPTINPSLECTPSYSIGPNPKRRKTNSCEPPATTIGTAIPGEMWHPPDLDMIALPAIPGDFSDPLRNSVAPMSGDPLIPETSFPAPSVPIQLPDAFLYAPPAMDFSFAPIFAPPVAPPVVPPIIGTTAHSTAALMPGLPPEQPSLFPPPAHMPAAPINKPQNTGQELTFCEDPLSMPKNFVPNPNNHGRHEIINGRKIYLNAPKEKIEAARASSGAAADGSGNTGGKRTAEQISN